MVDGGTYGFDVSVIENDLVAEELVYLYFSATRAVLDESQWGDITLEAGTPVAPVIAPMSDESIEAGVAYGRTPTLTEGTLPITWSLVSGPAEISIDPNTGEVTWADPQPAGSLHTIAVRATNSVDSDEEQWILSVVAVAPVIVPIADHSTVAGAPYSRTPTLTQGTLPVTWSLIGGPPGMSVNPDTGQVTWTDPQTAGDSPPVTVRAANSVDHDDEDWTLTVSQQGSDVPTPVIVASRTQGTVPLAIFFEGTDSEDAAGNSINSAGLLGNDIVEYIWDFGDGDTFSGFNAAHVYEDPGTYQVTLTARTSTAQASATAVVTAQPFSGTTYYVSSSQGSDSNTGLSEAAPFASYNRGMQEISDSSNKRLLFKRGDTFPYSSHVVLGSVNNVIIGAYGTGISPDEKGICANDPVLLRTGGAYREAAIDTGWSWASEISLVNIHIRLDGTGNGIDGARSRNFLLLRTVIEHNAFDGAGAVDGMFIVSSEMRDAAEGNFYYNGSRLALINSQFGPAGSSHNLYGSVIDRGVITGNFFTRPSNGRHNLRIAANEATSRNVVVSDNEFDGGDGWLSVQLAITSGSWDSSQHGENILFERNIVHSSSILIRVQGDYIDTIIRHNDLQGGLTFEIYPHTNIPDEFDGPRGLWFYDNIISNDGGDWFYNSAPNPEDIYVFDTMVNGVLVEGERPTQ